MCVFCLSCILCQYFVNCHHFPSIAYFTNLGGLPQYRPNMFPSRQKEKSRIDPVSFPHVLVNLGFRGWSAFGSKGVFY